MLFPLVVVYLEHRTKASERAYRNCIENLRTKVLHMVTLGVLSTIAPRTVERKF